MEFKRYFAALLAASVLMIAGCGDSDQPSGEATEDATLTEKPMARPPVTDRPPPVGDDLPGPPVAPYTAERVDLEGVVMAPPLPDGYQATRMPIQVGDQVLGERVVVTKGEALSKVIVLVENRELPDDDYKVTAFKAYLNGNAQMFMEAGYRVVEQKLPDPDSVDPSQGIKAYLTFENAEGAKVYMDVYGFFTNVGHCVIVVADNTEDWATLRQWGFSVVPK